MLRCGVCAVPCPAVLPPHARLYPAVLLGCRAVLFRHRCPEALLGVMQSSRALSKPCKNVCSSEQNGLYTESRVHLRPPLPWQQKPKHGYVSTEPHSSLIFEINTNVASYWRLAVAAPGLALSC